MYRMHDFILNGINLRGSNPMPTVSIKKLRKLGRGESILFLILIIIPIILIKYDGVC